MNQTADDFFADTAATEPVIVDRSTLERWAECPYQAWALSHLLAMDPTSFEATSGQEVHSAISAGIAARLNGARRAEVADVIRHTAGASRPDVQPAVLAAINWSAYEVARVICGDGESERHPDDILRYDDGKDERRGQLAMDWTFEGTAYRLTGELDLLMATVSEQAVDLYDWKSGRSWWTPTLVEAAFQFQFYAELVFHNYPQLEQVNVSIFMTAFNAATPVVEVRQKNRFTIRQRIESALRLYHQYHQSADGKGIPCHPLPERCQWCPVCIPGKCPMVRSDAKELPQTPEAMLESLCATEAAAKRMAGLLTERVRDTGSDIECGPLRFGDKKPPKQERAKKCEVYTVGE